MKLFRLQQRKQKDWVWLGKELVICTDFFHFLFPSKTQIQKDADSWTENGQIRHVSYTLRNYLVYKFYQVFILPSRKLAEIIGINPKFAFQIGAIAFDAASSGGGASQSSPVNVTHTCTGSNRYLFCFEAESDSRNTSGSSATYNSVSMTAFVTDLVCNTFQRQSSFRLAAPATGANTVAVSFTGTGTVAVINQSYTGVSQGGLDSFSSFGSAGGSEASPGTQSTTVVASNCWLVGNHANGNTASTAGAGTTQRGTVTSGINFYGLDSNGTVGTGSQSLQVTWTGNNSNGFIVASIAPPVANTGNFFLFM